VGSRTPNARDFLKESLVTSAFPVTKDDVLSLRFTADQSGGSIILTARIIDDTGIVQTIERRTALTASAAQQTLSMPLTDGRLIIATSRIDDDTIPLNATLGSIEIIVGAVTASQQVLSLISGYIAFSIPLTWPAQASRFPIGASSVVTTQVGTPGNTVLFTVPTGEQWEIICSFCTFVADATVVTRNPTVIYTDGVNKLAEYGSATAFTAGQTWDLTFVRGLGNIQDTAGLRQIAGGIADLILSAGATILFTMENLQAGDTFSVCNLLTKVSPL